MYWISGNVPHSGALNWPHDLNLTNLSLGDFQIDKSIHETRPKRTEDGLMYKDKIEVAIYDISYELYY